MREGQTLSLSHLRHFDYCKRLSIPGKPQIPNSLYGLDAPGRRKGTGLPCTRIRVKGNSLPLSGSSWGRRPRPESTWHWSDVIWQPNLTDSSIRENHRFHGEYLASTGPCSTRHYPLFSFFRFGFRGGKQPGGREASRPLLGQYGFTTRRYRPDLGLGR